MGGVAGNWADVLLVRMTSDVLKPKEQRFGYSNALSGVAVMARDEGVGSLFRGIVPNVTRAVLMNASQLATYDLFKNALLDSGYYKEGTWLHFSSSFLAGTVATTVCSPADVIKARIMAADGGAAAVVDKLRQSVKQEGIGFLFRGWSPAWIRLSPNVSHAEEEEGTSQHRSTSSFLPAPSSLLVSSLSDADDHHLHHPGEDEGLCRLAEAKDRSGHRGRSPVRPDEPTRPALAGPVSMAGGPGHVLERERVSVSKQSIFTGRELRGET